MDASAISIQLYSVRSMEGLEEQLALMASLGFTQVEPFGGQFKDPGLMKASLAKHGLKAPSAHVGIEMLRDDLKGTTKIFRDLGIGFLIVPAPPQGQRDMNAAGWTAFARELAELGARVRGEGLRFGWHNHHWEYATLDNGARGIDILFHEAPDMEWEADVAWIVRGGADPVVELAKYRQRVAAAHVKDIAPAGTHGDEDGWADLGHGTLDWARLKPALHDAGVKLYVLEHDKPNDPRRFATRSLAALKAW